MTTPEDAGRAPATDAAAALLAQLMERGVEHIVVSPGSRSQALALVAAAAETSGRVRVHVRIDERVAGFTALGIGRESGVPAAVVCTSGTAVANLMPAALEAHHAGVPLLLLTADRPPELRGVGANQTTRQPGLFHPATRLDIDAPVPDAIDADGSSEQSRMFRRLADDAFDAALGAGTRPAGPVHVNLPVREPLAGALPAWFAVSGADESAGSQEEEPASGALYQGGGGIGESDVPAEPGAAPLLLAQGPRTVVIAGADAGADAERVSHEGGWPLIAEIVSGARFGRLLVHGYRQALSDPELGGRVERVVVWGHPTLSREVTALLRRDDVEVVAIRGPGEPLNLNGRTTAVDAVAVASGDADRAWLGEWMRASRAASVDLSPPAPDADGLASAVPRERLSAVSAELDVLRAPLDRAALVDAVWRASWPHDRLVFGSSRLVRVADQVLGGKKVPVHANRGLAGIDGTIATATGVAIASQDEGRPGVTRVLLGDLALLHDVGALLLPAAEAEPRIQVIVGNDGGGTIFDGLEVASVADAAAIDRVQYTPQSVRLEHLALAYGWEYRRITTRAALDQALTSPAGGRQLIEVPLER
ncbi:2-succinyl-5-enolpyruvyl-6-hydroxy-3-cyclohexene-1-carboxylic-acid synthase [Microbacterium sp. SORGH_AS_0862]|uniref:2-succinyl-5-enolpyruvyl-6-hydroxy-3- cyclohexene-1-carboxylic-acid synthase n=1 Tax=Microbacterium sp. SORGH_AS_0862 TaxID=3041789 RepID=UPI00278DF56A|nr:2-succinyl-5-enolpyruvyl-6-hydroxy-3-cyclohexene-1-carboxylic-acid synthase [Microbacterium sp. SORGH_AS_0862]MDQ1205813.1 2-succinyl-5-enolpyruvyl-6-hydroxy-3-cyclohexene-1-carboxylate synthase [Microbacterium sp. SORGH_AS_0862]